MLSLIPALLLLAFQGPTALERLGHEGRLPSALRALERALTSECLEEAAEAQTDLSAEKAKRAFAQLAALTSDPTFSAAIAQFLQGSEISASETPANAVCLSTEPEYALVNGPLVPTSLDEGFFRNRRTRDGPQ